MLELAALSTLVMAGISCSLIGVSMFFPVDENGEELSTARLAELEAEHRHAIEAPGLTEPTELERAIARAWAQASGDPSSYELHLTRELQRRIRVMAHRRAQAAAKAERAAKRSPETKRSNVHEPAHPELPPPTRVGAHGRYELRRGRWRAEPQWRLRHAGWWWLHNLIVHPLLGWFPVAAMVRLHDWSSGRLSRSLPPESPLPRISSRWRWLVHNVGAHVAIGLWPCAATFRWHDATARHMGVPGWV